MLCCAAPQFAPPYDAKFTQRFIVVAADVTLLCPRLGCFRRLEASSLSCLSTWPGPEDIYELDLPEEWRAIVEEVRWRTPSGPCTRTVHPHGRRQRKGYRQLDIRHWFEPFAPGAPFLLRLFARPALTCVRPGFPRGC